MAGPVPVAEGIYCLEGTVPTPYFVRGEYAAIVDPGPASSVPSVLQALGQLGWDKDKVRYIIPTHIHLDHGGGAGSLAQELPQAQVVVYHQAARHLLDPSRLIEGTRLAFGPDFEQRFGPILPVPEARLLAVADGARLDLGGRELEIYHTPGHANHHISIFDLKTGALFCGEALGSYFPENEAVRPAVALPLFEVDVALAVAERGYRVTPQFKVGSKSIDLVVFGAGGQRLAIECDGDAFHGPHRPITANTEKEIDIHSLEGIHYCSHILSTT